MSSRRIIHVDLDAFYASVEQLDDPGLRGRAVIVGGGGNRGVVCACSYEARAFGVRSAMPMFQARRLCPQAICRPVRMERYRQISKQVFAVFDRYTDRVEKLSIDEAFLDINGCERLLGEARTIATNLRQEVRRSLGLNISAGVAPNKFLAKLASQQAKPDGLLYLCEEDVDAFLRPLPVSALWGVGRVTGDKLSGLGIRTVDDLRNLGQDRLVILLGSQGDHLYRLARGIDDRPVVPESEVKSIGHEDTYAQDIHSREEVCRQLLGLADRVAHRARAAGVSGRCISLKVKYADFTTVSRSRTLPEATDNGSDMYQEAKALLVKTEGESRPVRLLGISLSALEKKGAGQQSLFTAEVRQRAESLDQAIDTLRHRFGEGGVVRGSLLESRPSSAKKESGSGGEGG